MVVLVMGVSGSGKSAVGRALAERIRCRFVDGDDHHPVANVAKMRAGTPLTDEDRAPWLADLRTMIDAWLESGETVVLACSALTERIRGVLGADREGVHLVYLHGSKDLIDARMRDRDHFMPAALLDSQFALLEPPQDALQLDIGQAPEELVARIVSGLALN
jgi:carbohydrate kinase (thermoresistant glucokinase family)